MQIGKVEPKVAALLFLGAIAVTADIVFFLHEKKAVGSTPPSNATAFATLLERPDNGSPHDPYFNSYDQGAVWKWPSLIVIYRRWQPNAPEVMWREPLTPQLQKMLVSERQVGKNPPRYLIEWKRGALADVTVPRGQAEAAFASMAWVKEPRLWGAWRVEPFQWKPQASSYMAPPSFHGGK